MTPPYLTTGAGVVLAGAGVWLICHVHLADDLG
jgi:hypothetical protein